MHVRDSTSLMKDKDQIPSTNHQVASMGNSIDISEQAASVFGSSNETQLSSPAQDKPPTKKSPPCIHVVGPDEHISNYAVT